MVRFLYRRFPLFHIAVEVLFILNQRKKFTLTENKITASTILLPCNFIFAANKHAQKTKRKKYFRVFSCLFAVDFPTRQSNRAFRRK